MWHTAGITLYGKVCFFYLDDVKDTYISEVEKAKLRKTFQDAGLKPIIAVTLIAVSDDLRHNSAFIQHTDDKVFLPYITETIMKRKPKRAYERSDGAPTQFDNQTQYIWISQSEDRQGIQRDWCLHCTCHGKDKVDPELGQAKSVVKAFLLEENIETMYDKRIHDYLGVAKVLRKNNFETPKHDLNEKKGKGIYKRKIFTVPSMGSGSANQNIMRGKVDGRAGRCQGR